MQINYYASQFRADGSCIIEVGPNQHFTVDVERDPNGLYVCKSHVCAWNRGVRNQPHCEHVKTAVTVFENELRAIAPLKIMEAMKKHDSLEALNNPFLSSYHIPMA